MPERRAGTRARRPSAPRRRATAVTRAAAGARGAAARDAGARTQRRAPVPVLFLDVDGTLTDSVIAYTDAGARRLRRGAGGGRDAAQAQRRVGARARALRGAPVSRPVPVTRDVLELAREVVRIEAAAVAALEQRLDESFARAVDVLAECRGKVIVSGGGKSGLLPHKLAATLTSTGTPAVFLHPTDALHGDAGLFTPGDAALFVSKSGASDELLALLPFLH